MRLLIGILALAAAASAEPADFFGVWRLEDDTDGTLNRIHIGPTEWAVGTRGRGYRKHAATWTGDTVAVEGEARPYALRLDKETLVLQQEGAPAVRLAPVVRLKDFFGSWRFAAAELDWAEVLKDVPEIIHPEVRETTLRFARWPGSRLAFSLDSFVIVRGGNGPAKRAVHGWTLLDETTAQATIARGPMRLRLDDGRLEVFLPKSKVRWRLVRADATPRAPLDVFGTWRFRKSGAVDWARVLEGVSPERRADVQANLEAAQDGATTLVIAREALTWDGTEYPVAAWERIGATRLRVGFGGDFVDLFLEDGLLYLKSPHEGAALPFARSSEPEAAAAPDNR